jgi:hypothetical protein
LEIAVFMSPPDIPADSTRNLTPEQRIAVWADLYDACEQFLLAGLARKVRPGGDVRQAYREWYAEQMREHDRTMRRMVEEFNRRNGGQCRV